MEQTGAKPADKRTPPTLGLAAVADLWLWGALLLYAPAYLALAAPWDMASYILGFVAVTISFAGAFTELGKLLRSEWLNYWGVSLVFLIPGVVLFLAVGNGSVSGALETASRAGVLVLLGLGGAMFFQGVPYLFWIDRAVSQEGIGTQEHAVSVPTVQREHRANWRAAANGIVALLALATAVVTLLDKIVR
jgi:hypothetical protein